MEDPRHLGKEVLVIVRDKHIQYGVWPSVGGMHTYTLVVGRGKLLPVAPLVPPTLVYIADCGCDYQMILQIPDS